MRYGSPSFVIVEVWVQVADWKAFRKARREAQLSLRELAGAVGTSYETIRQIEVGGKHTLKPQLARKLERVLRLAPETVFVERLGIVAPEVSNVGMTSNGRVA